MTFRPVSLIVQSRSGQNTLITQSIEHHAPIIKKTDEGLLPMFQRHTSASLSIYENSDNPLRTDLTRGKSIPSIWKILRMPLLTIGPRR